MTEIAIELDDETAKRLRQASEKDGISPSAWVTQAIRIRLEGRLPDSFFAVLGTGKDTRSTEEILRDLRTPGYPHQILAPFRRQGGPPLPNPALPNLYAPPDPRRDRDPREPTDDPA